MQAHTQARKHTVVLTEMQVDTKVGTQAGNQAGTQAGVCMCVCFKDLSPGMNLRSAFTLVGVWLASGRLKLVD